MPRSHRCVLKPVISRRAYTRAKKKSSFEWSFQWKITLIFSMCVCKLESRMLITITNSNSSPEVNSSEVSLKSQCEFGVRTQKHPKHLLGGGAYVTFVFVRTCVYIRIRSSSREFAFERRIAIIIQVTNFLSCVRSDHSKDELQSSLQWSFKLQIFSCV